MDANATNIELTCQRAEGTRQDRARRRAFEVTCYDDGCGCDDPEILRRIGSSTSDLHAEKRGRFGQGLIDFVAACESAEILTLNNRLTFDSAGCRMSKLRGSTKGMRITAVLRHDGGGLDELSAYFVGVILPHGVRFAFNGQAIQPRISVRTVEGLKLTTVLFDAKKEREYKSPRATSVEIFDRHREVPMIHELGIPVDAIPWELAFDVNVLQKTPLGPGRDMLPDDFKHGLVSQLIGPLSDLYQAYMTREGRVPAEIRNHNGNAPRLSAEAQRQFLELEGHGDVNLVIRRNPFDPDDLSESHELQVKGYVPVDLRALPSGVKELLKDVPTVAATHDRVCKPSVILGSFAAPTPRQIACMAAYAEIASALLGRLVEVDRIRGSGATATYRDGVISLNIDVHFLWDDPLGEEALGTILHECAHAEGVSGHNLDFCHMVERLGGRLTNWVGRHPDRWTALTASLHHPPKA